MTRGECERMAARLYFDITSTESAGPVWDAMRELGFEHVVDAPSLAGRLEIPGEPIRDRILCILAQGSWDEIERIDAIHRRWAREGFSPYFGPP